MGAIIVDSSGISELGIFRLDSRSESAGAKSRPPPCVNSLCNIGKGWKIKNYCCFHIIYISYIVGCRDVVQLGCPDPWYNWGGPAKVGARKSIH